MPTSNPLVRIVDAAATWLEADAAGRGGAVWSPYSGSAGGEKITEVRPDAVAWLTDDQIDALLASDSFARRLVYGPAEDAIGRGWTTDGDATHDLDVRLGLEARVSSLLTSARQYGGAWAWLVTDDDAELSEPLPPGPHKVLAVHVIDKREAIPYSAVSDPRNERFLEPEHVSITLTRDTVSASVGMVHGSRLIYVPGLPMAHSERGQPHSRFYDLSVVQAYWIALRDAALAYASMSATTVEKSTPWIKLKRRVQREAGDDQSLARQALRRFQSMRSSWGLSVLGPEDEIGRMDATLSGYREVMVSFIERICALEGIPASALVGSPPAGMSTDDAAGERTYARFIGRLRRLRAEPVLRRIYEVEMGDDAPRDITWPSISPMSESERAEYEIQIATARKTYADAGAVDGMDIRESLRADETQLFALADEEPGDSWLSEDPDEDPEAEADSDTYAVPAAARNNARRVIRWREEHGDEVEGMTEVGWRRARQLATSERVGRDTVAEMSSFNRHRQNYERARAKSPTEPWKEAGIVQWLGWGGTTGIDWARRITGAAD